MDTKARIKLPGKVMWEALANDPAIGCTILDAEGTVLCINPKAAELIFRRDPVDVTGRNLSELLPEDWKQERLDVFHQILATNKPIVLRCIRDGRQLGSTFRLLDVDETGRARFIAVTTVGEPDMPGLEADYEVRESAHADLGRLDVLSKRELEVLALMSQGLTLEGIANTLRRSPKTIEKHRHSIGQKLQESSRVKLAQLAAEAGLELHDAELKRAQ